MKGFYAKVFDYIFDKRMDLFQAMFYKLYEDFKGDEELFLKAWFEDYAKRKLLKYFPLWDLLEYYPEYVVRKRPVLRSYINTYWRFCLSPYRYPAKVRESMEFFGIKELNLQELKKRYRHMIKKYHPDIHTDKKSAHKHMLLINYHYQILLSCLNKAE
jgi:hypothetical protein